MSITAPPFVVADGHLISSDTPKGKEAWSWETKVRIPGYRPENFPYPRMLYKAYTCDDGIVRCMDTVPQYRVGVTVDVYSQMVRQVEEFNKRCVMEVPDEAAHKRQAEQGWCTSAEEAIKKQKGWHNDMLEAAAHQNYLDRNMSEKAKQEKREYVSQSPIPVADIPEAPKVKEHWKTRQAREKREAKAS